MTASILAAWRDVLNYPFLENALWQWASLLGVLLASFLVGKTISFFLQRQGKALAEGTRLRALGMILQCASGPTMLLLFAGALSAARLFMNLRFGWAQAPPATQPAVEALAEALDQPAPLEVFWGQVATTLAVLAIGWFIYRLVDVFEHFMVRWAAGTETLLDDQLVPMVRKTLRVFVVIVVLLFLAQNVFHWNIGALIAGLGIGGLAFALAAKDLLANLFGSVTIFADRPFHMGDRIVIQGYDGMVEEVGFRTTRVRTLDGHLVTVPNSVMVSDAVENISRRPSIKRVLNVTVTYDTPPEKLKRGVEILNEMLAARSEHFPDDYPPRVYFSDFNAASLNIIVYYWFTPPDWWEYMEFTHAFNMELLERYNAEGIEFAFPTQTLYLKQDSDLSAEINTGGANR